jgi:hypothetical protein
MSDSDLVFTPQIQRHAFPHLGVLDSEEIDALADEAADDILKVATHHNALVSTSRARRQASHRDIHHLMRMVAGLQARLDQLDAVNAARGVRLKLWHDLHDAGPVSFLSAASLARRAQVSTTFGHATVPMNAIQSRFYGTNLVTGAIVPSEGLSVTVEGTFDNNDGQGVTDHEHSTERLDLDEGNPQLAFNGVNIDTWVRRLEFPLDSDVTEIETQVTVRVPTSTNVEGNTLVIYPHPVGNVDVTGVFTAPDLADTFTTVPNFTAVPNATPQRWYFPAQKIQQIRVWLRQRDWVEENGKKVFYVGAQEIGLYLVDWDKTWDSGAAAENNNSCLVRFDAPTGYGFKTLHLFNSDPMYTLETSGNRHLHFQLALDDGLADVRWNSDTDALPQSSGGVDLGGTATSIYVLCTMNWVETSGGMSSPFEVGSPPYLAGLGLETTVSAV